MSMAFAPPLQQWNNGPAYDTMLQRLTGVRFVCFVCDTQSMSGYMTPVGSEMVALSEMRRVSQLWHQTHLHIVFSFHVLYVSLICLCRCVSVTFMVVIIIIIIAEYFHSVLVGQARSATTLMAAQLN